MQFHAWLSATSTVQTTAHGASPRTSVISPITNTNRRRRAGRRPRDNEPIAAVVPASARRRVVLLQSPWMASIAATSSAGILHQHQRRCPKSPDAFPAIGLPHLRRVEHSHVVARRIAQAVRWPS